MGTQLVKLGWVVGNKAERFKEIQMLGKLTAGVIHADISQCAALHSFQQEQP